APPVEQVTTSLLVTGPYSLRRNLAGGMPFARAVDVAQAGQAAAGMRHVLSGGREAIVGTVREDRRALGWARATSGNACAFCQMLAGRGAVYARESADFEALGSCGCTAEPVYSESSAWPPGAREARERWDEAKARAADEDVDAAVMFRRLV